MHETLTLAQFSTLVGVHPATVRRWIKAGHVIARRLPSGHWRVLRSEADRLLRGSSEFVLDAPDRGIVRREAVG